MQAHQNHYLLGAALLALLPSLQGCSGSARSPSFDVDLAKEVYRADFGGAQGTLPDITCNNGSPSPCDGTVVADVNAAVTGTPTHVQLSVGCDSSSGRCFAQATARLAASVDVQLDNGFVGKLEGRLVSFVHVLDLVYAVPENSLTFDVPYVDVYVGPAGATQETDAGVVSVGRTDPVAAKATLSAGHLTIVDGSPAHAVMQDAIRASKPFAFVLVLSPKLEGGSAVPAGTIEVDVTPRLTIGL